MTGVGDTDGLLQAVEAMNHWPHGVLAAATQTAVRSRRCRARGGRGGRRRSEGQHDRRRYSRRVSNGDRSQSKSRIG